MRTVGAVCLLRLRAIALALRGPRASPGINEIRGYRNFEKNIEMCGSGTFPSLHHRKETSMSRGSQAGMKMIAQDEVAALL